MRERFDKTPELGMKPIEETPYNKKSRDGMHALVRALLAIFVVDEYREQILDIVEEVVSKGKKDTGRKGLSYWQIFVLAEFRMALNLDYDRLETMCFSDKMLRQLIGIESVGFDREIVFSRKRIVDNVHLLSDEDLKKINSIIIEFGHKEVFVLKKKKT